METLNDFMADFEAERLAEVEREEIARNTPEAIAAREAKRAVEFERGVRLGWHDADGNSLVPEADDDEESDEEDED